MKKITKKRISVVFGTILSNFVMLFRILRFNNIRYNVLSYVHRKARIITYSGKIRIGKSHICDNTEIMADGGTIVISDKCFINRNCTVCSHSFIVIGEGTTIGPNVCIYDHDHDVKIRGNYICSDVIIGSRVWIGANSTILKGVKIGDNSIVAAGSVVTNDVLPNTIVAGVPAKTIRVLD